jgi:hypothetical protein
MPDYTALECESTLRIWSPVCELKPHHLIPPPALAMEPRKITASAIAIVVFNKGYIL